MKCEVLLIPFCVKIKKKIISEQVLNICKYVYFYVHTYMCICVYVKYMHLYIYTHAFIYLYK